MGRQSDDRSEPWVSVQRRALRAFPRIANRYHRRREPTEDPRGAVPRGRDADRAGERNQVMMIDHKHRGDTKKLREFYEATGSKGVLWIDDATGRIVQLPVESRIRPGEGGCQLCHQDLDGTEKHGRLQFDERRLPRLIFGPGVAICDECLEWVRLLDYHAENGSVATPRFEEGDLVLR